MHVTGSTHSISLCEALAIREELCDTSGIIGMSRQDTPVKRSFSISSQSLGVCDHDFAGPVKGTEKGYEKGRGSERRRVPA